MNYSDLDIVVPDGSLNDDDDNATEDWEVFLEDLTWPPLFEGMTLQDIMNGDVKDFPYYFLDADDRQFVVAEEASVCPFTSKRLQTLSSLWNTAEQDFDWRGEHVHVTFLNTKTIERAHHKASRFGKTTDVTVLWSGEEASSEEGSSDYIVGAAASCIIILIVFALWMVILLVLRHLGPSKVGFWSGRFADEQQSKREEIVDAVAASMNGTEVGENKDVERHAVENTSSVDLELTPDTTPESTSQYSISKTQQDEEHEPPLAQHSTAEPQRDASTMDRVTEQQHHHGIQEEAKSNQLDDENALNEAQENANALASRDTSSTDTIDDKNQFQAFMVRLMNPFLHNEKPSSKKKKSFADKVQHPFAIFDPTLLNNDEEEEDDSSHAEEGFKRNKKNAANNDVDNHDLHPSTNSDNDAVDIRLPTNTLAAVSALTVDDDKDGPVLRGKPSVRPPTKNSTFSIFTATVAGSPTSTISTTTSSSPKRMISMDESLDDLSHHDNKSSLSKQKTSDSDYEDSGDEKAISEPFDQNQRRWQTVCRIVVAIAGFGIVLSAIVMATTGVGALLKTMDHMLQTLEQADELATHGVLLMDNLDGMVDSSGDTTLYSLENITDSTPIFDVLVYTQDQICGGVDAEIVCKEWAETNADGNLKSIDSQVCLDAWGKLHDAFDSSMNDLFEIFDSSLRTLLDELQGIQTDLMGMSAFLENTEKQIKSYKWIFAIARAFNVILAALCLLIVVGLVGKWPRLARWSQHWVTIPLFAFLVLLSTFLALLCIFSATVVSDFCIDGPDARVLSMISKLKTELSILVYDFVSYFINQCPVNLLPQTYTSLVRLAWIFVSGLHSVSDLLVLASDPIEEFCGTESNTIATLSQAITSTACNLSQLLTDTIQFFQCESFWSLYKFGAYNTLCVSTSQSIAWIAGTQLAIVVFAGIILTFRAAFSMVVSPSSNGRAEAENDGLPEEEKVVKK